MADLTPRQGIQGIQSPAAPPQVPSGSRKSKLLGGRRAVWISTASTILFLALLVVLVTQAPNAAEVGATFFSREHLRGAFPQVVRGFWVNVRLFVTAEALVLVFALVLAVLRSLPGPVLFPIRLVTIAYIDFFRGMPLILWLFICGFGLPGLDVGGISHLSRFSYSLIALVMIYSAYVAEVYRAGIESVHDSQTAAARSLGLSSLQSMRFVILPQAIRRVVPPLLNDFIGLQKDTALVATIGTVEAVRQASAYGSVHFNFAGYAVAAILFVSMTIPLARFTDWLLARQQRRMRAGGGRR